MPFDGSGNYNPAASPNFPAVGGTVISSAYYNNVINDIASALSNTLTRDGQGKPAADLNWNGKSLTNVNAFGAVSGTFSGALQSATLVTTSSATIGANLGVSGTSVNVSAYGAASPALVKVMAAAGYNTEIQLREATDGYGFTLRNLNGSGLNILRHSNNATGVTAMYIGRDTGNVGIGTASPTKNLSVVGSASPYLELRTNAAANKRVGIAFNQSGVDQFEVGTDLGVSNVRNFYVYDTVVGSVRMLIDPGGNFGIGTSAPGRRLDVVGPTLSNLADQSQYAAGFANTGGSNGDVTFGSTASMAYMQSWAKPLYINSQGNGVYFGPGNVGIGTVNPSDTVEVRRDQTGTTGFILRNANTGGAVAAMHRLITGTTNSYVNLALVDGSYRSIGNGSAVPSAYDDADYHNFRKIDGTVKMTIDASGNVGVLGQLSAASLNPTNPLAIAKGGTGAATAVAALAALGGQTAMTVTTNANGTAFGFKIGSTTYYLQVMSVGALAGNGSISLIYPVAFTTSVLLALADKYVSGPINDGLNIGPGAPGTGSMSVVNGGTAMSGGYALVIGY